MPDGLCALQRQFLQFIVLLEGTGHETLAAPFGFHHNFWNWQRAHRVGLHINMVQRSKSNSFDSETREALPHRVMVVVNRGYLFKGSGFTPNS